jgi:cysteine desulfurase/selenocysteine lyase
MITTAMDHNSVLRPLNALAAEPFEPRVDGPASKPTPRPVSSIPPTSAPPSAQTRPSSRPCTPPTSRAPSSPSRASGRSAGSAGVPLLVDAAQSAGRLPIDVGADGIDLLAAPGHKHLLGPLGTGLLAIRPGLESRLAPLEEGGTGTVSELDVHPETMPDRYEPGSHNTIGIVGLSEGVAWIQQQGVDTLWAHERALVERACDALADTARYPGLTLIGSPTPDHRVGVFSVTHDALPPADLANILESEFGVLTRAGIHCAPRAHANFQTVDTGGATRLSVGPFTSTEDLETALDALAEICAHTATAS